MAQINDTVCSNIDRGKHKESNWRATSSDVIPSRLFINSPHNVTCGRRLHQTNMKQPGAQARARQREVHCLLTPQTITSEHFRSWKFACHCFRRTCHFALWSATTSREALQVVWRKESTWAAGGLPGHRWDGTGSEYPNCLEITTFKECYNFLQPNSSTWIFRNHLLVSDNNHLNLFMHFFKWLGLQPSF